MKKLIYGMMAAFLFVALLACRPGYAAQAEWRAADYNFSTPKFVLLTETRFAYEGYDVSGRNKFNRFPYAADKIPDMLRNKLQGLSRHRLVDIDYVVKQIKADPAVTEPVDPSAVAYHMDTSHGMQRVETTCSVCDAHLGHVFPDGPQPSGLRFCINALALDKVCSFIRYVYERN